VAGDRHPRFYAGARLNYPASVGDLLAEAEAELYADDPDGLHRAPGRTPPERAPRGRRPPRPPPRRPAVAKKLRPLRKPTRSAWVVTPGYDGPGVRSRLDDLAATWREASGGGRLRELTAARAKLVDELDRTALEGVGRTARALREEVTPLRRGHRRPEVAAGLGTLVAPRGTRAFGGFAPRPARPAPRRPRRRLSPRPARGPPPGEDQRGPNGPWPTPTATSNPPPRRTRLEDSARDLEAQLADLRQRLAEASAAVPTGRLAAAAGGRQLAD